jgi:hypothetical protein
VTPTEAKGWIGELKRTGAPVHPKLARQLYEIAGKPIPDRLRPRTISDPGEAEKIVASVLAAFRMGGEETT